MTIEWISVKERVPLDRHTVLVWGISLGYTLSAAAGAFLGTTKFNPSRTGGKFDCEGWRSFAHVTHWAEIEGPRMPDFSEKPPPANP